MDCNYRTSVYILSLDQCFWDSSLPQAGTPRVFWSINVHHWHLLQHLWFFCCSKEEPRHSLLQYSVSALPTNRAKASSRITARSVCRCLVSSWVYVYVESQLDLLLCIDVSVPIIYVFVYKVASSVQSPECMWSSFDSLFQCIQILVQCTAVFQLFLGIVTFFLLNFLFLEAAAVILSVRTPLHYHFLSCTFEFHCSFLS